MEDMSTSHVHTSDSPAPVLSSEDRSARIAVTVFPLLILAAFAAAMIAPAFFQPLAPGVNWALGIIMFGMGLTLTVPDFGLIIKRPLPVFVGVAAQYLIMPLVGWALCYVFRLPDAVAVGVILVGCAPGGTASNVISYLAKADVALSVTMTSI
ncbi:MAG: bile acid:sodium symporter family protein, partial [Pauljensenia sp.]